MDTAQMNLWVGIWMDAVQTVVLVLVAIVQIVMLMFMRGEMRRASGAMQAISRQFGALTPQARRIEELEEVVARLIGDIECMTVRRR